MKYVYHRTLNLLRVNIMGVVREYETKYSILNQVDLTIKTVEFNINMNTRIFNRVNSKDTIFALTNQIRCILLH